MATDLSAEEREVMEQAFNIYDTNGDGFITIKELGATMKKLGFNLTIKQLEMAIKVFDEDGDGKLNFDEFVKMAKSQKHAEARRDGYLIMFKQFDKNGDGKISQEELKEGMKKLGVELDDEMYEMIIDSVDKDGDGCLNYEEFIDLMLTANQ